MRIRLNTIFYFILAADLALYFILFDGTSPYLDGSSILYYIIFTSCILFTVIINGKRNNIFLELLIAIVIVAYHFRIPILFCPDVPTIMARISISSALINGKILELSYHYLALSLAIVILNPRIGRSNYYVDKRVAKKVLWFSSAIIFFDMAMSIVSGYGQLSSLMGPFSIVIAVFSRNTAMLFVMTYVVAAGRTLSRSHKYWAAALIVSFVVHGLYSGLKGSIALLIIYYMLATLLCYGPISINAKKVVRAAMLLPLIGLSFFTGDIMRYFQRGVIGGEGVVDRFRMIGSASSNILYTVSSRLGLFDYYVEASENSLYLPYISFKYYCTSIVDKLTPGFDVFGSVYASRMFAYARQGGFPKIMHSDQMTLFGEASVMFSSLSIIWFVGMIVFFAFLVRIRPSSDSFINIFYVAVVFHAYWEWLYGFGFDMFLCQATIYPIICVSCMLWYCRFGCHK